MLQNVILKMTKVSSHKRTDTFSVLEIFNMFCLIMLILWRTKSRAALVWRIFPPNFFLDMDVFWAECYEMTKVLAHKRSREVGESKLKFQAKYEEPHGHVVKVENTRFSNFLGKITKLNR